MAGSNWCKGCGVYKQVCCGFTDDVNDFYNRRDVGDIAPNKCADCCEYKSQHEIDNELRKRVGPQAALLPDGPCKRCVGKEVR